MAWLDKQEPCSVVLASYGTVANLDAAQLEELGNGLCDSGKPFVWVLRPNEAEKLSQQLGGRCKQRGLVVTAVVLSEATASSTLSVNHGHWSAAAAVSRFSGSQVKSPFRTWNPSPDRISSETSSRSRLRLLP